MPHFTESTKSQSQDEIGFAMQEPIAIVGSACRFPGGASSPSKLWDLLRQPRDVLCKIPQDRFNPEGFYHSDGTHHGTSNVTESYLLQEDPRVFDLDFSTSSQLRPMLQIHNTGFYSKLFMRLLNQLAYPWKEFLALKPLFMLVKCGATIMITFNGTSIAYLPMPA
ncbi:lovastatin nonaketide synthase [Colletotrichum truncatum]|uniref:Lovastatin nonaketide synthase n=1 Tax=Colletotrichum truncatum TaxID=5467 RepID=A0ACC3Z027_COLTU|nr:lovastatin nonaketide synthase [Colletotrichum truncatum]KAF6800826.1 lovastatin nonaketide synthase [Colletotrichum truncatum]